VGRTLIELPAAVAAASTAVVVTLMDVPSGCVTVVVVEDITVVVEGTAVRVLDLALQV
jgi:hypothetical protein